MSNDIGKLQALKDTVYAEVKMRLLHAADIKPEILEHHAEMIWRHLELDIANLIAQEANKAQLAIVERILEAGDGTDFVNQMANAAGELAKIYGELTAHKESKG